MRRLLVAAVVVAGIGAFALVAGGAGGGDTKQPRYWVELDNAFGLIPGADFKIAGVRAGKITEMKVDRRTHRALVGVQINRAGFPLRTDVYCESRPQSLIGEYFIDCNPGRNATVLKSGATIPVTHTASTIPMDLVNNILRLPQRERLRIILNELGTGVAARGEDLNAVIRRAVPALRTTDQLLNLLANENQTIADMTVNADRVVGALAANRGQLIRFVREARDTAAASADRRVAFRQTWQRLPAFLEQLRPTMVQLGQVSDEQIPALRDLDAASGNLKRFLDSLGPFSEASRPAIGSLGSTASVGRDTIPPARRTIAELNNFTPDTPELGKNLAIVLNDLYDRKRAVEPDPKSPGGKGFNGFEALLRYAYTQSEAINIFDKNGYILKVAVILSKDCGAYRDQSVKDDPAVLNECKSWLGPNQPGITTPDPTSAKTAPGANQDKKARRRAREVAILQAVSQFAGPAPTPGADQSAASTNAATGSEQSQGKPKTGSGAIDLGKTLDAILDAAKGKDVPALDSGSSAALDSSGANPAQAGQDKSNHADAAQRQRDRDSSQTELLDYLFAP